MNFLRQWNIRPCIRRRVTSNSETLKAGSFVLFLASFLSLYHLLRFLFLRPYQPCLPCRLCFFSTVLSVHYDLHVRINRNFKLHPCVHFLLVATRRQLRATYERRKESDNVKFPFAKYVVRRLCYAILNTRVSANVRNEICYGYFPTKYRLELATTIIFYYAILCNLFVYCVELSQRLRCPPMEISNYSSAVT